MRPDPRVVFLSPAEGKSRIGARGVSKDRLECLRLLATEVVPALCEHGKKIGLVDPFERKPGSRPLRGSSEPEPAFCFEALA